MHSHHITFSKLHLKTARQSYLFKNFQLRTKICTLTGCLESGVLRVLVF